VAGEEVRTKQVIVMRKDLNMRKGKMVAQGAHASMAVLLKYFGPDGPRERAPAAMRHWLENSFTKVVVGCGSLEELEDLCWRAADLGVPFCSITDNGNTEFHGNPTVTCAAFGPDEAERVDEVTAHLPLL
jgi:peptidyl-tRNA hydrolase, PTH2 family